jgi:pimeloyl-ACP methyl ester carboxylesterase
MPGAFRPSSNEIWAFKKELKDLDDEIRNISCDVYVVHGDKDTFVPVGNAYYAQKSDDKCPFISFENIKRGATLYSLGALVWGGEGGADEYELI